MVGNNGCNNNMGVISIFGCRLYLVSLPGDVLSLQTSVAYTVVFFIFVLQG